LLDLKV